jgi:geranylgeranyl diphosphate synthase, type I
VGAPRAYHAPVDAVPVDALDSVRAPVDALLREFLAAREQQLVAIDARLAPIARAISTLVLAGGKRMRPAFVYWGYRATGAPHSDALWHPAAAVELLQAFALIHDDVMDRSVRRRGRPAVHVELADHHGAVGLTGDGPWFGIGAAVLAGDLAFVWADELFDATPVAVTDRERGRTVFTELRSELMAGQYLDLLLAASADADPDQARRVALLKAGRYTVTRPLHLGAAIGGAGPTLRAALLTFGDAVGVGFQLRDDILGLFGNPNTTGKGVLDDLRQGKRTVLILEALERCHPPQRAVLTAALGDAEADDATAERVRAIVRECGALADVERQVRHYFDQALQALEAVDAPARPALEQLATRALFRDG